MVSTENVVQDVLWLPGILFDIFFPVFHVAIVSLSLSLPVNKANISPGPANDSWSNSSAFKEFCPCVGLIFVSMIK